jgi:phospholipid/cholesterol/gamma-HCH transport system substrate-binding protein
MAGSKHDFTATEIRAGALVLASLVVLVVFVVAVRGCRPRDESAKTFYASFTDISGLNRGADVRFGGVRVGRVTAIEPHPEDISLIRITAEVSGGAPVNRGSIATIEQVTLTSEMHLEISTGGKDQPLLESDTELTAHGASGFMDIPDLDGVVARLEEMLDGMIALIGVQNAQRDAGGEPELVDLVKIFASLETTLDESTVTLRELSATIGENRPGFREIVTRLVDLEEATTKLASDLGGVIHDNREPLHQTALNLESVTREAGVLLEDLAASLRTTLEYFEDIGGHTSDMVASQRPTIEEILANLEETTRNLKVLSRTLADQPQALVRGAKAQGRRTGETK